MCIDANRQSIPKAPDVNVILVVMTVAPVAAIVYEQQFLRSDILCILLSKILSLGNGFYAKLRYLVFSF